MRREINPSDKDLAEIENSTGYKIDIDSNQSLHIANEDLFHMSAKEAKDAYRVANIVDRNNLDTKEQEVQKAIGYLEGKVLQKSVAGAVSANNNETKHTIRKIELMECLSALAQLIRQDSICEISQVKPKNKAYPMFCIEHKFNEEETKKFKNLILSATGTMISIGNEKDGELTVSTKFDSLGFAEKNVISKLKSFVENQKERITRRY